MSKSKSKPRPPRRPLCGREAAGLLDRCAGGSPGLLNPGRLSGLLDRCAGGRLSPVDRCARTFAAAALADGSRREARWAQLGPSQQRVFFDWCVCVRVCLRTAQSSRICNALRNAHARTCARPIRLCLAVCATSIVCVRTWFGRHAEDVCAACLGAEGILRPPLAGHGVEPVQLSNRSVPAGGSARGTGTARAPTCKSNVDQAQANAERRYARMQNKSAS